jgi:hypothetical protein
LGSNSFGHWFNDEIGGFLQHSPVKITVLKLRVSIAPGSTLSLQKPDGFRDKESRVKL